MDKLIIRALVALFLIVGTSACRQSGDYCLVEPDFSIDLYPQGPAESNMIPDSLTYVDENFHIVWNNKAGCDFYIPKNCNGQMVVICPGGGYKELSMRNEGWRVADRFYHKGVASCIIRYRMPNGNCRIPLADAQAAMRYCREHAAGWGIRQVGIMGFSAGGNLASNASVHWTDSVDRPDFAILIYPVTDLFTPTKGDAANKLTDGSREQLAYYSSYLHVNADTPRTFIAVSQDDKTVPISNSIKYYEKLTEFGVSSQLHIYETGGHGWGFSTKENSGRERLGSYREAFFKALDDWMFSLLP